MLHKLPSPESRLLGSACFLLGLALHPLQQRLVEKDHELELDYPV